LSTQKYRKKKKTATPRVFTFMHVYCIPKTKHFLILHIIERKEQELSVDHVEWNWNGTWWELLKWQLPKMLY